MATVLRPGKAPKTVKNLGWLMRNAADIVSLDFTCNASGGGELVAHLDDGGTFRSPFASYHVARGHFLDRPTFQGHTLRTFDAKGTATETIGSVPYRAKTAKGGK